MVEVVGWGVNVGRVGDVGVCGVLDGDLGEWLDWWMVVVEKGVDGLVIGEGIERVVYIG